MAIKYFLLLFLFSSIGTSQEKSDSSSISAPSVKKESEKISFKKDVMPIFRKKCLSCHNTDDGTPSNLYFDDYSELMKGDSKHGPVVVKGKGEKSVLIMKLRGTADFGKQMPRGRKPLDDETIDTISAWINQGAKNN